MKKIVIAFLLAVVIMVTTVACEKADLVLEMAESVTSMTKHKNVETEMQITSNMGAIPSLTYEDFLTQIKNISNQGEPDLSYNLDMIIKYSYDENANFNFSFALPSQKDGNYIQVVNCLLVNNKMYLSTDIIKSIVELSFENTDFSVNETLNNLLSNSEYIEIDFNSTDLFSDFEIDDKQIDNVKKSITDNSETLAITIRDIFTKIITDDIVTKSDGFYVLTLDEKNAVDILNALVVVLEENSNSIIQYVNEITSYELLNEGDISEIINQILFFTKSEEWNKITGNFVYSVKSDEHSQETNALLSVKHTDFPIEMSVGFYSKTSVLSSHITAPTSTITFNEIVELFEY